MKQLLLLFCFFLTNTNSYSQQAWTQVPTPNTSASRNILFGIGGMSSSDVWGVGSFETATPGELRNLVMHWDGTGWLNHTGTDLSATYNEFRDVTAISSNDVWIAGAYNDPGTTRAQLAHWNGSSWIHTALPLIPGGSFLNAVDAIATNDIWAVGGKSGSPMRPCYALHYNGSSWTDLTAASPGTFRNYFNAVDGLTSNDVWAVGYWSNAYGDFHAMAQHWDGASWTNFSLPANTVTPLGELYSVTMITSNDVWATGSTITGNMLLIHWDGSSWSEISTAGAAGGIVISRGTDVFSVGDRISQWNGTGWTVIDPLSQLSYPSLVAAVVFPNGDIWTSGRTWDNAFYNLVYRTANARPQFVNGAIQTLSAGINAQNIDLLLKAEDADISQVVIYSIITPPSNGTLTGLPDTMITVGGFVTTSGVSYLRNTGHAGTDQFVVEAGVGPLKSQTTINVASLVALPVIISSYSVNKLGNTAAIKWTTNAEINAKEFVVERSSDGTNFISINRINARGYGSAYMIVDRLPGAGWNYYRLKLIDMDGKETIYPVRGLRFEAAELKPFVIIQNPVAGKTLTVKINEPGTYDLSIFDALGRKLFSKTITHSDETMQIPIGNYPGGTYILLLEGKPGSWSEKFLIN